MSLRSTTRAAVAIVFGALLAGGSLAPTLLAAAPDRADVVLVLDFSASILDDKAIRNRFGAALERIADRVDETSRDLIAGDATMTIVQFAARAADYDGCVGLKLLGSPATVGTFADCLRSVAGAYRKGPDPALTKQIGIDTNYVAAMEQAATHLPADAVRPVLILFSDGKHDVAGVPVAEVAVARDRLFANRSPFALLPVGMGLDPAERGQLEAGLLGLRIIRDMPACASGTAFEWPQVVFESPDEAGVAVAVALQGATCTFTVAPTQEPTATPTAAGVRGIRLTPLDGRIDVSWSAPPSAAEPMVDYRVRCAAGDGEPIESADGVSLETTATVEGLTNGTAYRCEVAVVRASSTGEWTAAATQATPMARPAAPGKPSVEALNGAVRISVAPNDGSGASGYHYDCSGDNGGTWPQAADVASTADTAAQVGNLTNGVAYVCRAFAENDSGLSDASPLSDAVKPCGSLPECLGIPVPLLGIVAVLLAGAIALGMLALLRGLSGGYVVAVVDVVHTANLGNGSSLGIRFVRPPDSRQVDGILAARGSSAEIRIRQLRGGRFKVTDRKGTHVTESGEPVVTVDSMGVRHELVLRAFAGKAASAVSDHR
jgi:Fibronectin type III domain